jgi:hypothetical protein
VKPEMPPKKHTSRVILLRVMLFLFAWNQSKDGSLCAFA